jgi:uncharacterized protein YbaP (TraB family)
MRAALAALFLSLFASPALAEPPVWSVRDADSELIIFGSVHVLPPGLAWRPARLDAALAAAEDVWFELPIGAEAEAETARLAGQRGMLAPHQSLFALLGPKDGARLLAVGKRYGLDPVALDRLQPWLADVALASAAAKAAGAAGDSGVEETLAAATPAKAARRAFESPAEQIGFMADGSQAEQIAALRQSIAELEEAPDQYARLVRAWVAGDIAAIDRLGLEPLRKDAPGLFRRLVADRNARWAATLDNRLKGSGRTVVVVGVGHLIGSEGVPARLRALGYRVEGP